MEAEAAVQRQKERQTKEAELAKLARGLVELKTDLVEADKRLNIEGVRCMRAMQYYAVAMRKKEALEGEIQRITVKLKNPWTITWRDPDKERLSRLQDALAVLIPEKHRPYSGILSRLEQEIESLKQRITEELQRAHEFMQEYQDTLADAVRVFGEVPDTKQQVRGSSIVAGTQFPDALTEDPAHPGSLRLTPEVTQAATALDADYFLTKVFQMSSEGTDASLEEQFAYIDRVLEPPDKESSKK